MEDWNRHFKEDRKIARTRMKRWSTLLINREMQIKTTKIYQLKLVKMAIIKKSTNRKCWRRCGDKGVLLHCWRECKLVQLLWRIWRLIKKIINWWKNALHFALQNVGVCCTTVWISHNYTYFPSLMSLPPQPSHPSRSSQRARLGFLCCIAASH